MTEQAPLIAGEVRIEAPKRPLSGVLKENIPMEEYLDYSKIYKRPQDFALSKSMLSDLLDCPKKFMHNYVLVPEFVEEEKEDHLNIGSAVHTLALEQDTFNERFFVIPEGVKRDKRTSVFQRCISDANGRTMLTFKDYNDILGMASALAADPVARALFDGPGYIESSIFFTCPYTGLRKRVRPDWMRKDGKLGVNIKTSKSSKPDLFFKSAAEYSYDIGAAMELEAMDELFGPDPERNYVLLVIESESPYIISAFDVKRPMSLNDEDDNTAISYADGGKARMIKALHLFQECTESGNWPGYVSGVQPMRYPGWMMKRVLETGEI